MVLFLELGTNPASDVTFGDNTKAIFGAGSDLQIYHDGSDSYIVDNGTGDLLIRAENNLFLKRTNSDETYFSGAVNGAVTLFHNNNAKLATTLSGVDITGTVTADAYNIGALGSLGSVATDRLFIATADGLGIQFDKDNNRIVPIGADGSTYNNNVSLGSSGLEFKNLALSGTATMAGLTVDGNATLSDSTNSTLQLKGLATAGSAGDSIGRIDWYGSSPAGSGVGIKAVIETSATTSTLRDFDLLFKTSTNVGSGEPTNSLKVAASGDISFYNTAGNSQALFWDASAESLGIGTTTPAQPIEILKTSAGAVVPMIQLRNGSASAGSGTSIKFMHSTVSNATSGTCELESIRYSGNLGALTFKTSNNGGTVTERMRVDDAGVGIGTSPNVALEVDGGTANGSIARFHNENARYLEISAESDGTYDDAITVFKKNTSVGQYAFRNSTTEYMRIDASGNVGIGVVPESYQALYRALQVGNTALIGRHSGGTSETYLTANSYYDGAWKYIVSDEASVISQSAGVISFLNAASGTADATISWSEAMRIDASGNLLVDKTAAGFANTGHELRGGGSYAAFTRDGGTPVLVNRKSSDGTLVEYMKDGTTVGVIGSQTLAGDSELFIGNGGNIGLAFEQTGTDRIFPCNGSTGAERDAAIDLGSSSARFGNVYRSGSTISTSDRNMKQDIRDLTDAERNVAVAAKGLLKAFRFINTVEAEGDSANIHFGIIAQDLAAAFTAEGLDANDYQVYCADTFTDDDGNEQTRLGICYENLLAFIIAAI